MSVNRRKFITHDGRIVETNFDVYWCCFDKNGAIYLYGIKPKRSKYCNWWKAVSDFMYLLIGYYEGIFYWKKARFYLKNNGEWVRK